MIISNPKTREFLELNAPYWLGRIDKTENTYALFSPDKQDEGVTRTLSNASTCLMGEIYGDSADYNECLTCSSLTNAWLIRLMMYRPRLSGDLAPEPALDKLILHQIECHKKPELKIPIVV